LPFWDRSGAFLNFIGIWRAGLEYFEDLEQMKKVMAGCYARSEKYESRNFKLKDLRVLEKVLLSLIEKWDS